MVSVRVSHTPEHTERTVTQKMSIQMLMVGVSVGDTLSMQSKQ